MTALEERLRAALAGLAEELPPSHNPLAEQRRRLAAVRRSPRPPMLAAAAAAVVLAALVPATVVPHQAVSPPPDPGMSTGYDPGPQGPWMSTDGEPTLLAEFTDAGRRWAAWGFVQRQPAVSGWEHRVCALATPVGEPIDSAVRHPNSADCGEVLTWSGGSLVRTMPVLSGDRPASGPLPGLLLFVTAPSVARLEVCAADGRPVPVRTLHRNEDLTVYLADFGPSYDGFCYTARDTAGTVLESAIS